MSLYAGYYLTHFRILSGLYYNPRRQWKVLFWLEYFGSKYPGIPKVLFYLGYFGSCVNCPSVRLLISGSAPKFICSVLLGFRWVRLWLPTSSRTISRRHLSISVVILRILVMILRPVSAEWKVPSTTEYKFGFRFAYIMDVIWNSLRIQTVIFYNVWRSCYFEYLLP